MIRTEHRLLATWLLVALTACPVLAQGSGASGEPVEAVSAELQFERLTEAAKLRIERALLIDEDDVDARRPLFIEAERYARAAAQLMPSDPDGWFLIAASLGLRCQYESMRQQVRMGGEIWSLAETALERDSAHAGAHHVLGRLNLEAMSLSGVGRMIATHLFGSQMLRRASWQQAEQHLRKAAQLEPEQIYHQLWLARLYIEHGDEDEARTVLRTLVTKPAQTEVDEVWLAQAREDLAQLD